MSRNGYDSYRPSYGQQRQESLRISEYSSRPPQDSVMLGHIDPEQHPTLSSCPSSPDVRRQLDLPDVSSSTQTVPSKTSPNDTLPLSTLVTRDPRLKGNLTSHVDAEPSIHMAVSTNNNTPGGVVTEVIRDVAALVSSRELNKQEMLLLEGNLQRDISARDAALQKTAHRAYIEQLEGQQRKSDMKVKQMKPKLEKSKKILRDHMAKAVTVIDQSMNEAIAKHVASLEAQLKQERALRESETARQDKRYYELELRAETLSKSMSKSTTQDDLSRLQLDYQSLSVKIQQNDERIKRYSEDIQKISQNSQQCDESILNNIKLLQQAQAFSLSKESLSDTFASKSTIDSLASELEVVKSRLSKSKESEYVKQSELKAYIESYNAFIKDYTRFRESTGKKLQSTPDELPRLVEQLRGNIEAIKSDIATTNTTPPEMYKHLQMGLENVRANLKTVSDEIAGLKPPVNHTIERIKGLEHAIRSLNSRYNNLTSEPLAKQMTNIIDARSHQLNNGVSKIKTELDKVRIANSKIESSETKLARDFAELQSRLTEVVRDSTKADERVLELQASCRNLETTISDLRSTLEKEVEEIQHLCGDVDETVRDGKKEVHEELSKIIRQQSDVMQTDYIKLIADFKDSKTTIEAEQAELAKNLQSLQDKLKSMEAVREAVPDLPIGNLSIKANTSAPHVIATSIEKKTRESTTTNPQRDQKIIVSSHSSQQTPSKKSSRSHQPSSIPSRMHTNGRRGESDDEDTIEVNPRKPVYGPRTTIDLTLDNGDDKKDDDIDGDDYIDDDDDEDEEESPSQLLSKFQARSNAKSSAPAKTISASASKQAVKRKRDSPSLSQSTGGGNKSKSNGKKLKK